MTQGTPLGKKPTACVPCHERKVRCDLTAAGVPCTRCVTKGRVESCTLLERGSRTSNKRRRYAADGQRRRGEVSSPVLLQTPSTRVNDAGLPDARLLTPVADHAPHRDSLWNPPSVLNETACADRVPSFPHALEDQEPGSVEYMVSEDDAHLHTLRRMQDEDPGMPSPVPLTASSQGQQVIEYYGDMNSVTVLGEALGQSQRRLIRIDLPGPRTTGAQQREFSRLGQADMDYLLSKEVRKTPQRSTCRELFRLFFDHVYPYTPILDRQQLITDYEGDNCSTFLLWSILAVTAPYASSELLHHAGWTESYAAQKDCCSKAKLLYDFGCERSQLILIQGSLLLSSIQYSFNLDKHWRFWFHNSVRIATQMGFHRRDIGKYLDAPTHRLVRRIWWVLYSRDVWFSLAGFENNRWIHEDEPCIPPLQEDDWTDDTGIVDHVDVIPSTTSVQRHFLQEHCQLAIFGARFLRMFACNRPPPGLDESTAFTRDLTTWRSSLPEDILIDRTRHWTSGNAWILFLWAMSFRLECSFYRMLRQRTRDSDPDTASWANSQLLPCTFELDTVVKRAIVHEVAQYLPPALLICASHLLSFQLEIALDPTRSEAQRLAARTQTHTVLGYLHQVGDRWRNAKWTSRVFETVMKRLGFAIHSEDVDSSRWTDAACWRQSRAQQDSMASTSLDLEAAPAFAPGVGDVFPGRWFEDLLAQNLVNGLDYGWLSLPGP